METKPLLLNGFQYSRTKFDGYTHRAFIRLDLVDGGEFGTSIYTTDPMRDSMLEVVKTCVTDKVVSVVVEQFQTKEQDDAETEWIMNF